jgi:hypothetical protein
MHRQPGPLDHPIGMMRKQMRELLGSIECGLLVVAIDRRGVVAQLCVQSGHRRPGQIGRHDSCGENARLARQAGDAAGMRTGLAERLSARSVRLARMILIQAIRNAMVNDLVMRNVGSRTRWATPAPGPPRSCTGSSR